MRCIRGRGGALGALGVVALCACQSDIQLGRPDIASVTPPTVGVVDVPKRCPGIASRSVVAVAEPSWGDFRAVVIGGGTLYALFARRETTEGVIARVPTSGGTLTQLARVGLDPSALAIAPDASFVFASARGSSQVFRVDSMGTASVSDARGPPSAIVADDHGGAFWTIPSNDSVAGWDFARGAPSVLATSPRPSSLVRAGDTLYLRGNLSLSAFAPGRDAARREIASRCDAGTPAIDGTFVYCAESGSITRVDRVTGEAVNVATDQRGAGDVVLGAGRVFWRTTPTPSQSLVMALPLDGVSGPTVVDTSGPSALLLGVDGCDLYFTSGRSMIRRGL